MPRKKSEFAVRDAFMHMAWTTSTFQVVWSVFEVYFGHSGNPAVNAFFPTSLTLNLKQPFYYIHRNRFSGAEERWKPKKRMLNKRFSPCAYTRSISLSKLFIVSPWKQVSSCWFSFLQLVDDDLVLWFKERTAVLIFDVTAPKFRLNFRCKSERETDWCHAIFLRNEFLFSCLSTDLAQLLYLSLFIGNDRHSIACHLEFLLLSQLLDLYRKQRDLWLLNVKRLRRFTNVDFCWHLDKALIESFLNVFPI